MAGTISKPQNSYTYIEVKNLDIDHDIEYNIFIYVHRYPPGLYEVFSPGQTACPISGAMCSIP